MTEDEFSQARKHMVADQLIARGVRDPRVLAVMGSLPRHLFVSPDDLAYAYGDGPLPIGRGQTISQPFIVALMTELLQLKGNERVLEIGTGSGYQAAVLASLAGEVYTTEIIPELAGQARQVLQSLELANVHVHISDGSLGWPEHAPYDRILVTAAAPSVPMPLKEQLADGGRMVIPTGARGVQGLEIWTRQGDDFKCEKNIQVAFVPLRGEHGWK
jgi:protein-L-isoaspartate(D-aspartate) O-methyltransferase